MPRSSYVCPRCSYTTVKRANIITHLERKRPCADINHLELTEEIKEIVLRNRIYHPPKEDVNVKPTMNVTNNNVITNIQNIINNNMTPVEKLMKYAEYKDIDLIPLDEDLNDRYANLKYKLKKANESSGSASTSSTFASTSASTSTSASSRPYNHELRSKDFQKVIDEISQSNKKDFNDFNIIYDTKMNKISILDDDGEWKETLIQEALYEIIYLVQDNYFDEYETYLIKRTKYGQSYDAQCAKELLREYYRFISIFDLQPFCIKDDTNFLKDVEYGSTTIKDEFYPMYLSIKDNVKLGEKKNVHKTVLDIIKRNSAKNLNNLNTSISSLFSNDSDFQQFMIENEEQNRILGF